MPSLIAGYEYDIFISYRHNDNLPSYDYGRQSRSGWVTEFVKNLQEELAATIKEPVSVYFDADLKDGLLEAHNVGKTLEVKLKCLIFIPILSQTYCDPKSFAWQHEFCAFNKLAMEDQFGLDVKLRNGNITSRLLPVKIHDLDPDDRQALCERTGGPLRSIEFIYKKPGVNRPLRPNDEAFENLNNTKYRNQVNKVANVVKEIITGLKNFGSPDFHFASTENSNAETNSRRDKSIVVLPFEDISPGKDQEYFCDGLAEELISALAKVKDIHVVARTSAFSFKGKEKDARKIGKKLNVESLLEGSVRRGNHWCCPIEKKLNFIFNTRTFSPLSTILQLYFQRYQKINDSWKKTTCGIACLVLKLCTHDMFSAIGISSRTEKQFDKKLSIINIQDGICAF